MAALALAVARLSSAMAITAVAKNDGESRSGSSSGGLAQISSNRPVAINHSFVSPQVELFGDVRIGKQVFIAANTVLRADPRSRICIGNAGNMQDDITLQATTAVSRAKKSEDARGRRDGTRGGKKGECGTGGTTVGREVSIAHRRPSPTPGSATSPSSASARS